MFFAEPAGVPETSEDELQVREAKTFCHFQLAREQPVKTKLSRGRYKQNFNFSILSRRIVRVPLHQNFNKFSHFCFNLTEIVQL